MQQLLKAIRHNPLPCLLAFMRIVFASQKLKPEAPTPGFLLSVLAIEPLAALPGHATESAADATVTGRLSGQRGRERLRGQVATGTAHSRKRER